MCFNPPKIKTPKAPAIKRVVTPVDESVQRENEMETMLRRRRSGVAADVLTTPLGLTE